MTDDPQDVSIIKVTEEFIEAFGYPITHEELHKFAHAVILRWKYPKAGIRRILLTSEKLGTSNIGGRDPERSDESEIQNGAYIPKNLR